MTEDRGCIRLSAAEIIFHRFGHMSRIADQILVKDMDDVGLINGPGVISTCGSQQWLVEAGVARYEALIAW
eukprot:CAMPEP_0197648804 /NCGR_PEP_ID=MMETSP1338-20131121/27969_1 /TAXON_ID=43686 ORGANISM="Pelagodinium beii, Strain RCC1491" /NCGR_SAMPLE_ID=MMETSP1338 /ASSEMBLY_ACC=CAM_ASM_000754 /LENGTH=70 /DNA_ID=CAMNT_0043222859 /DNA_START=174 /DNA_END=383 /DNA_ORIENTATION=+